MIEQYGQWQTSQCGHAALKVEVDTIEDLSDDFAFTITVRNCERVWDYVHDVLLCAECGATVDDYDPVLCEALDEEGRKLPYRVSITPF